VDVFIPKDRPYDLAALARRKPCAAGVAASARTYVMASAEDVILAKLEWFRQGGEVSDQQWKDILGVMKVQGELLDQPYLTKWAHELSVADLLEKARRAAGLQE